MLDDLYDDVLSVMDEVDFIKQLESDFGHCSPLKWCYGYSQNIIQENEPKINRILFTHDSLNYTPNKLKMLKNGDVSPYYES